MYFMGATKRSSRVRGPFILLVVFSVIFGLATLFVNFEVFSGWSKIHVLPRFAQTQCNGSTSSESRNWISSNESRKLSSLEGSCGRGCAECSVKACPPAQERIVIQEKVVEKIVVEEKIVEKIVNVNSGPFQWWAEGKSWHHAGTFPLCSMDACFNYSRCENMDELLVYHYHLPTIPVRYFESLNTTTWYTSDPEKACLFFVFQDLDNPERPHPNTLEHWNNGLNHVLITFADLWIQRNPPENSIENASVLSSGLLETTHRPGFDIGIPLPGRNHHPDLQTLKPLERKFFLTFRGTRYLGHDEGTFRSHPSLRHMHNGEDVIVVTTCAHFINDEKRLEDPRLGEGCDEDQKEYDKYEFGDLMNSTFSLAPAGKSCSSYRFIEVLSTGAIPVLIADNHVKPFENIIQWPRCVLQFPTSEMHRLVSALRGMSQKEMVERQKYCLWVYETFLKDDATLLRTVMLALKARFYGVFAGFSELSSIYSPENDR